MTICCDALVVRARLNAEVPEAVTADRNRVFRQPKEVAR